MLGYKRLCSTHVFSQQHNMHSLRKLCFKLDFGASSEFVPFPSLHAGTCPSPHH